MTYELLISPKANIDIEEAYVHYNRKSPQTILKFDEQLLSL